MNEFDDAFVYGERVAAAQGRRVHEAMKILAAALLYFLIVFGVGFLVGPVRVLYVEPRVGSTAAVMLEAPILLARW